MPQEDNISLFYNEVVKPLGHFKNENEFRAVIKDSASAADYYKNALEPMGVFGSVDEFNQAFSFKKKNSSTPSANPSTDPLLQNMAKYGQQGSQQDLQQPTQSSVDKEAPEFGEAPKESTPIGIQKPIVEEKKKTPTEAQVDVITSYYMDKGLFNTSDGGIKVPKAPTENTEVALRNKEGDVTVYKDIKEAQSLMTPEQFAEQTPIEASSEDKTEGKIYEDIIFPEEEAKALSATKILDYTQDKGVHEIVQDRDALNKEASLLMGKETNLFNDDGSLNQAKLEFVQDYAQDKINNVASFQHERLLREAKQEIEGLPTLARTANVWASTIFEKGLIGGIAVPIGQAFDEVAVRLGMKDEEEFRREKALVEQRQAIADYKNKLIRGISEEDLDKGVSELAMEGKFTEAASSLLYGIIEQVPNFILGSKVKVGMAIMGVSSASSHYQSIRDRVDISEVEKIGQLVALGVADWAYEKLFPTDINIINNGVVYKGLRNAAKSIRNEGGKEGFEEFTVALLEQAVNYRNNGKFSVYAIADATAMGTVSGSTVTVLAQGVSALNHHVTEKQIKKQQETYNVLSKELLRSDLSVHEKINVRSAMKESLVEIQKLKDVNKKLFSKLSAEDATKLVGIHQEIWDNVSAIKKTKSEEVKAVLSEKVQRLYAEKQAIEQKYTDKTPETPETISENVQNVTEELREYTDDESVTLTVKSLDEIPEPFRDRAERGIKPMYVRKTFLGIPYGKEATKEAEYYKYTATGKELKDYVASTQQKSNQEVTNRVVTSEAVNEPVSGAVKTVEPQMEEMVNTVNEKIFKNAQRNMFPDANNKEITVTPSEDVEKLADKDCVSGKCETNAFKMVKKNPERYFPVGGYFITSFNAPIEHWWIYDKETGKQYDVTPSDPNQEVPKDYIKGYVGVIETGINDEIKKANSPFDVDFFKGGNVQRNYFDKLIKEEEQQETLTPKETENAIPLEISGKSLLREEQPQVGLQKVGKGNAKQEGAAKQGKKGGGKEEKVVSPKPDKTTTKVRVEPDTEIPEAGSVGVLEKLSKQDIEYLNNKKQELQENLRLVDVFKNAREKAKNDTEFVDLLIDSGDLNAINKLQENLLSGTSDAYGQLLYNREYGKVLNDLNNELKLVEQSIKETTQSSSTQTQATQEVAGEKSPVFEAKNLTNEPTPTEEKAAEKVGITPKNLRDLYAINRDMFGQNKVKAFASAVIMDKMIGAMAIMKGVSKAKIYATLEFRKGAQTMPDGVKFQVDAWHGSPYQFDKFELSKIGSGEGAQAFGWGLYFTDLKSIAEGYANNLSYSKRGYLIDGNFVSYLDFDKYKEEAISDIIKSGYSGALDIAERYYKAYPNDRNKKVVEAIKSFEGKKIEKAPLGAVYKVSLHKGKTPDQYTWLEWDKPVSDEILKSVKKSLSKLVSDYKSAKSEYDNYVRGLEKKYNNGRLTKVATEEELQRWDELLVAMNSINRNEFIDDNIGKITDGQDLYFALTDKFKSDKDASLFLLSAGIDGNKYPAESVSRGATSDNARGFNYVVFDENAVSIEEVIKFQKDAMKARGAMMMALDGKAIIYALTDPNVSTPLHELAHVFEHYLTEAQKASVLKWTGATEWSVEVSEKFARGFEKYLADGKAPTVSMQKIFDRFKEWLTDIYNGITGSEIDVELNDDMKALYGKMLGVDEVSKKKDEEVAVSEKKAKETAKALKEGFKLWLSQQKQSNIIFDPRSKAAQDMALTRLIINHAVAVGADTVQKIKDIIDNMTNGSLELTRDGAEYIIDLAFPSHNKTRSRILGFATKAINSALNAKEGIESNITNAMVISKETAKEVDKQREKAVSEYAKKNSIKKDEARKEVNRLMNNLLAPEENNTTSYDAFLELELVSPSLANSVQAMRNQIDAVTKSILEDPAFLNLSPALRKKMEENLGNYTHREYLFFSSKNKNKELRRIANKLQINKDLEEIGFWNPSERLIDDAAKQYAIEHADPSSGMPMSYDDALDAINALIDDWKAARDPLYTEQADVISSADLKLRSGALKKKTKLAIDQALWFQAKKEAKKLNPNAKTTVVLAKAAEIYESLGGEWSDMPEYLRNLLGEIKDPVSRYINTITAMSAVLYKGKAMKDIIDNYSGFGWVSTKEPRTDKKDFILVDDKFSPIDGMWVHKNIINEFNQKAIYQTDYAVANAYFTVQNWFRRTKILPNPATWFKNVVGGYYGQVLNGEFYGLTNPSVAAKSLWGRLTEMTAGQRTEFMKGVFADAAEAGVLSSGVDVAVMGYLDDMFISIENRDFSQFEKSLSKLYHKSVNKVKSVSKEAGRRYSQVDDHSKAILVYSQKYDVANQIFDKDYDNLTDKERTEVLKETGNMVKKTMPTFSRLPSWFRTMSRIPFFGDFLSFKIEAIRSFAGAVSVALEHGANAALPMIDPRTEKEYTTSQKIAFGKSAAKRFAGITAIAALNYAVIRGLFDSDDDDEEKLAAERKLLKEQAMLNTPEWTVGKSLIYKGVDKNGNVKFLDYSGQDPYSDVITLVMGNTKSLSDIFKPSLTMQAFSDVWNGESGDWRLYWETDPWITKAAKSSLYLSENLVPPFISSSKYELDKKRKEQEDYANFSKRGFTGAMGDYASVVAPRITVRDYSYNVYSAAKNFAYKINKDYNVPDIKKVKTEKELYQRIANLKKMRDNYKLVMLHVSAYPDSYPKKDLELVVKAMKSGLNFSGTKKESYGEKNFFFNTNDESAQKILDFWLEEENVKRRLELNNKPKK